MNARKPLATCLGLALLCLACLAPAAQASFGINSLQVSAHNKDATVDTQAGSHPYEWTLAFNLNLDFESRPEGSIRDIIVDLPPGEVGNPQALPHCATTDFEGATPQCPGDSQIGIAHVNFIGETLTFPLFNMVAPLGVPARIGFSLVGFNSLQEASLRSDGDYGITVSDITVPQLAIRSFTETVWGVPADPSHDAERFCPSDGHGLPGCASEAPLAPFFTLPTSCGGPLQTTLRADSVEEPGVFHSETVLSGDEEGEPFGIDGCNAVAFKPEISSQPTTNLADSPTGLNVDLHQPQDQTPTGSPPPISKTPPSPCPPA